MTRARVAGLDALVVEARRPLGTIVFANAATSRGIDQPGVRRLLEMLGRARFTAVAPELPGLREGEVTPATLDALVRVARACGGSIALVGVSTGAGLAILAAADERLAPRVASVAAVAPFASLRKLLCLATTGTYDGAPFAAAPLVRHALPASLRACAADDPAVGPLLANTDPHSFDALYAALAPESRATVGALSPLSRIARVTAPIELATAPDDPFFPLGESRALARAGDNVRLTVTTGLDHVSPRLRPGFASLLLVLARTLWRASTAERAPVLRPVPAP